MAAGHSFLMLALQKISYAKKPEEKSHETRPPSSPSVPKDVFFVDVQAF